ARRELTLVLQRNFSPEYVATLAESALESAMSGELPGHLAHVPGAPRTSELVPIVHRGQRVAVMAVGAYVYSCIPSSLRAGLHNLGAITGNAVSRILAERSRGDAVADLEAFITIAPLATWLLDPDGRLTMWNRAAESLLGWRAGEVLGRRPPFHMSPAGVPVPGSREIPPREVKLLAKDGTAIDVRLTIAPFRDLVGNASTMIVMAEGLSPPKSEADVPPATAQEKSSADGVPADGVPEDEASTDEGGQEASARPAIRLLVVDGDTTRARRAARVVEELGWEAVVCPSLEEAALSCGGAHPDRHPFSAAFVELISPDGSSGLELKARLRQLGLECPIIVCSDAEVLGYEFHGFAGLLKRPYDIESLKATVRRAVAPPT
ncbi:MAG TPA: PAS domain-containing protein, partial [Thermoleophilia bacterium]|nr:PAS domain-containing protein [Thermoleophilia bacterium]